MIAKYFRKKLNLEKDDYEKFRALFLFVLGKVSYSDLNKWFKQYSVGHSLSKAVKSVSSEFINYVFSVRSGLNSGDFSEIDHIDLRFITRFGLENYTYVTKFESEETIFKYFEGAIYNQANSIKSSIKDSSISFSDLVTELNLHLLFSYRKYIFNVGLKNFNSKVFYMCLHKTISSKKIDVIRKFRTQKDPVIHCVSIEDVSPYYETIGYTQFFDSLCLPFKVDLSLLYGHA